MTRTILPVVACAAALAACLAGVGARPTRANDDAAPALKPLLRRPAALALADDGQWLFAANRRAGTISVIDTAAARAVAEVGVGGRPADLVATPDGGRLLAVDEEAGELVILDRKGSDLKPVRRVKVSPTPVGVCVSADGARAAVASLWARRVSVVDLGPTPRVSRAVDLPFAPRRLLFLPGDRKVVVADAFGGAVAVLDVTAGKVESVRSLPGHNVGGLALSADGKRLLVSHQVLNPLARTTLNDIHWGNLMSNYVRALAVSRVLDPAADLLRDSDPYPLGDASHGTGDPAGVAVLKDGRIVVALAGVGETALGSQRGDGWQTIPVGMGPTAVTTSSDGRRAYVANTLGDSVSVVDLAGRKVAGTIGLGPRAELKPADRGEQLFRDARLSHDGWMSCHSCHTDGHSNGRLADTLGDGTYGTPKRVPSLLGVKDTAPYAWNGSVPDLASQVRKSVETTMRGKPLSSQQVSDLTAYLETLAPPPARDRLLDKLDETALRRGHDVFGKQGCATCHAPPAYTSA
ncbi:MAG TPA: cytochrome c peroxidase, partial [Gemmataceae bacterium]|nr:cytochrome c peroxidase [Gemmataceae bacterium]